MKWIAAFLILFASPLAANCVVPSGYSGRVKLTRMEVLVVHRGRPGDETGYQEMLVKLQPQFIHETSGPRSMVWVIPIRGASSRHDTVAAETLAGGAALHEELFQLAREQWADKTDFKWPSWLPTVMKEREGQNQPEPPAPAHTPTPVGPYEITQIRSTGKIAIGYLANYLREHGMRPMDPAVLEAYEGDDISFLCVRVVPPEGKTALGIAPDLPPLAIGFETSKPFVALNIASGMGDFALDLTIVSDKTLETDAFGALRRQLNPVNYGYVQLVNLFTVKPLPETLAAGLNERARQDDPSRWYVNRIESHGANPPTQHGVALFELEQDGLFMVGDITDELPGFWYYGDEDISFIDRFFREHAMAVFVGAGLFFFVTLFIKVRINRKRYLAGLEKSKTEARPQAS
jgi:hypothetical protein